MVFRYVSWVFPGHILRFSSATAMKKNRQEEGRAGHWAERGARRHQWEGGRIWVRNPLWFPEKITNLGGFFSWEFWGKENFRELLFLGRKFRMDGVLNSKKTHFDHWTKSFQWPFQWPDFQFLDFLGRHNHVMEGQGQDLHTDVPSMTSYLSVKVINRVGFPQMGVLYPNSWLVYNRESDQHGWLMGAPEF